MQNDNIMDLYNYLCAEFDYSVFSSGLSFPVCQPDCFYNTFPFLLQPRLIFVVDGSNDVCLLWIHQCD